MTAINIERVPLVNTNTQILLLYVVVHLTKVISLHSKQQHICYQLPAVHSSQFPLIIIRTPGNGSA